MARRSSSKRNPRPTTKRHYPRTARLNTLLQEIVADHLERVDDDRIGFLTVTGVEVDADLNKAQVFISTLADESQDDDVLEALDEHRKDVQASIGRSARLRKTPEIVFAFDPAVRAGARIEGILATLDLADDSVVEPGVDGASADGASVDDGSADEPSVDGAGEDGRGER